MDNTQNTQNAQQQIDELNRQNQELENQLKSEVQARKELEQKFIELDSLLRNHRHLGYDNTQKLT